jgi:K+ transporter
MIFSTIKSSIIYVTCLNVILGSIVQWLVSFSNSVSNLLAYGVSIAGIVLTYYTIIHIKTKIRGQRLDNKLKEKELNK